MGAGPAHRLSTVGHDVRISNSRGLDSLREVALLTGAAAQEIGPAVHDARVVVLAIPYSPSIGGRRGCLGAQGGRRCDQLSMSRATGPILGPVPEDPRQRFSACSPEQGVKAFNNLPARMLREPARKGDERVAIPIAAADNDAARIVEALIADLGVAAVRVGTLAEAAEPLDVAGPVFGAVLSAPELRAALGLI